MEFNADKEFEIISKLISEKVTIFNNFITYITANVV